MLSEVKHEIIDFDQLDPKEYIVIKGARVNNLKNLSVAIPRNKFVVITGLSGSGKSSLAFDTLFAEGQRMYVESLSSYARQFLGRMEKPEVDYIRGVAPAISIEQKVNTRNPRSTVGTQTEIYDYLKLLFARIGKTYSPVSGELVKRDTVTDVVDFILSEQEGTKFMISASLKINPDRGLERELDILLSKGYSRLLIDNETVFIEDALSDLKSLKDKKIKILIDRASVNDSEELQYRISDSVQTAFFEGHGICIVWIENKGDTQFSDKFEADGIQFEEPTVNFFSFNNPFGACKRCEGFGKILGIDEDLVIPDKSMSVYEGAIAPWRSESMKKWQEPLQRHAMDFDFPIHRSYNELDEHQKQILWEGNEYFQGINDFFRFIESKLHKIQYRVLLSRYRGRTVCPECKGTRLRKDANYVKINGKSISEIVLMPVNKASVFFQELDLNPHDQKIGERLLKEIQRRLFYLEEVGLGYITLNRLANTLSGGEFQRIKLSTSLGSSLVGSLYVLDEPTIGLHPRDTNRLVEVIRKLKNLGNTVVVVEHEEEVIKAADQIIDIGPDAGSHGGQLVFQGTVADLKQFDNSKTSKYLSGASGIKVPDQRRHWQHSIIVKGARENNLKNIDVEFPLKVLSVVTGVSGSGKSTLINDILYPAISRLLGMGGDSAGKFDKIEGDYSKIKGLEMVNQNPIGRSSRSNPVTYIKAYDQIRQLYAAQPLSKQRGYKPSFFSFNVDGGRCETCQGEGIVVIEMQFMADLKLTCEDCKGKRFKPDILEVKYQEKSIADILEMTVDDSVEFFRNEKTLISKLKPLQDVGLGYITLGQSSDSLSGGEAQRVKLASFLGSRDTAGNTLFIFDEPTTGLHFHDIFKLMEAINRLVENGNTAIIIEHNMEVIKCADWIIDLGPEGGEAGGKLNFAGLPEDLVKDKSNHTARFLKEKI